MLFDVGCKSRGKWRYCACRPFEELTGKLLKPLRSIRYIPLSLQLLRM